MPSIRVLRCAQPKRSQIHSFIHLKRGDLKKKGRERVYVTDLIESTLDIDLTGEKTNSKSLFIQRVFTVQTRKNFPFGWFKTARGRDLGLVAL